jgi:small subunit ribosomal protein S19
MTRSKWKGPFLGNSVLKNVGLKKTKIWSRSSVIPGFLVGETVYIHNGKEFKRVVITREKIGYKFGDFSLTRKFVLKSKFFTKNK